MSEANLQVNNFNNALVRLREGIAKYDEADDLLRDGLIQRFKFTSKLAWKTLKAVFEDEGITGLNSPKTVLREAFAAELIKDDELWFDMLSDRISTAHNYNERSAIEMCQNIKEKYVIALVNLLENVKTRLGK